MANFSFDVVSEVDLQEADNAVNQAKKELSRRYDFKNSKSSIEFDRKEKKITLIADDDYKLRALKDILLTGMANRKISSKSLKFNEPEKASGMSFRQTIDICTGIEKDKAKELVAGIKKLKLKVQVQIEGEKLRVSSPKKNDLQAVIEYLKNLDFALPLNFCNYR
ncbi:MAG: YajQ family cyclic di-GMP-binding protein [Candidatus Saelkia tenebricola]|nr:YajQ family cyclic di-GMP-binding protein [Candidatus Saelkia tenebricola]